MKPTKGLSIVMSTIVLLLWPDASLLFVFNPCCVLDAALWIWKDTKKKRPPALTWQDEWKDLMENPAHSGSSLTHSLTYSLTCSPTHSTTHPLTHSSTHSPTHSFTHPLTHTHVYTHLFSYSLSSLNQCCCMQITCMGIAGTSCS